MRGVNRGGDRLAALVAVAWCWDGGLLSGRWTGGVPVPDNASHHRGHDRVPHVASQTQPFNASRRFRRSSVSFPLA